MQQKRQKLGDAGSTELSQHYRGLTPEQRSWYEQLGRVATSLHREGSASFPCLSNTARRREGLRLHQQPMLEQQLPGMPLEQRIKVLCRQARSERMQRRAHSEEACKAWASASKEKVDELLHGRQLLAGIPCSWLHLPHSVQAFQSCVDLVTTRQELLGAGQSVKALSELWSEKHRALAGGREKVAKAAPLKICHRLGHCVCWQRGKTKICRQFLTGIQGAHQET